MSSNESPRQPTAIAVDPAASQKIREVADELQISQPAAASLLLSIANSKRAAARHARVSKAATFLGLTLLSKAKTDPVSASIVRSLIKCATLRYRKTLAEIRLEREPKTDAGDDTEPDRPIIDESAREACPVRVDAQALEKVRALADVLDSNQVTAASLLIEVASRTTAVNHYRNAVKVRTVLADRILRQAQTDPEIAEVVEKVIAGANGHERRTLNLLKGDLRGLSRPIRPVRKHPSTEVARARQKRAPRTEDGK